MLEENALDKWFVLIEAFLIASVDPIWRIIYLCHFKSYERHDFESSLLILNSLSAEAIGISVKGFEWYE